MTRLLCQAAAIGLLPLPAGAAEPAPGALPSGASHDAAVVSISTSGNKMTVRQSVQRAIVAWDSYNIGRDAWVDYSLPGAGAISLNTVLGNDPSQILGRITSNGQVWLLNPNGVLFGQGSRVDVAGMVASSFRINDDDFLQGRYKFIRGNATGSVVNQGEINAFGDGGGGLIGLFAPEVRNEGILRAQLGNVALAAGDKVTLEIGANGQLGLVVDPATLDTLVENRHLIQADGGQVLMSARAAAGLTGAVINNGGAIEAHRLTQRDGIIRFEGDKTTVSGKLDVTGQQPGSRGGSIDILGEQVSLAGATLNASGDAGGGRIRIGGGWQGQESDAYNSRYTQMDAGSVLKANALTRGDGGRINLWADGGTQFAGRIEARGGAQGGNGGNVEVSGKLMLGYLGWVDTTAAYGQTGNLLLDPTDITISTAADSNITAATPFSGTAAISNLNVTTLETALAGANVTVDSSGGSAGTGNITLSDAVTWSSGNMLALKAWRNIYFNANVTSSGAGLLWLQTSQSTAGGTAGDGYFLAPGVKINLTAGHHFLTKFGSGAVSNMFNVITDLGLEGSSTITDLQGISGNTAGAYALGADIDASASSSWNAGAGFMPLSGFSGRFDGLGHSIDRLTINRPTTDNVGLMSNLTGRLDNTHLTNANIVGRNFTGGLANTFNGVSFMGNSVGGTVTGGTQVGGLIGAVQGGTLSLTGTSNTFSGIAKGAGEVGGLIGLIAGGVVSIDNALSTTSSGAVQTNATGAAIGGLVGSFTGGTLNINNSCAGTVMAAFGNSLVGGLVGLAAGGTFSLTNSFFSTGLSTTGNDVGGLVGELDSGAIAGSFATGNVGGASRVGGLVGRQLGGSITDSYATGSVTASGSTAGGLVGDMGAGATVTNSYATGAVSAASSRGGLVGNNNGTVSNSFFDHTVNAFAGIGGGTTTGATGMSTTSMHTLANFNSATAANGSVNPNWSISGTVAGPTWFIYEGHTAPLLQYFMTPLTVTAGNATRSYDGQNYSDPIGAGLSYSLGSSDMSKVLGIASLTYANTKHAGTYSISPSGLIYSNQLGYLMSYGSGTLTVDPAQLTALAAIGGTTTKTYNGTTATAATLSGSISGGVGGDTFTLDGSGITLAYTSQHVGATIGASGSVGFTAATNVTGWLAGDYVLAAQPTISNTGSINAAHLTATAILGGTLTKGYDGSTTVGGATVGGTVTGVNGDTFTLDGSGVTLAYQNQHFGARVQKSGGSFNFAAATNTTGWTAGDYVLDQPAVTPAGGGITATHLTATATLGGSLTKTYDGTTAASGATVGGTVTGVNGDTFTLDSSGATLVYNGTHVGAHQISLSGSLGATAATNTTGWTTGDYVLDQPVVAPVASTITPANLTVTANNDSRVENGMAYSGGNGVGYSGFVNAEDSSVLGGSLTYGGNSQGAISPGLYFITPGGLSSTDYAIGFVSGTLTIASSTGGTPTIPPSTDCLVTGTCIVNPPPSCVATGSCDRRKPTTGLDELLASNPGSPLRTTAQNLHDGCWSVDAGADQRGNVTAKDAGKDCLVLNKDGWSACGS